MEILGSFPKGRRISLEGDVFPKFVEDMAAFKVKGYFVDIGIEKDYRKFNRRMSRITGK